MCACVRARAREIKRKSIDYQYRNLVHDLTYHDEIIAGGSEQHAGALQMPRHVRLMRAEDLLEGRPGLSGGRQNPEGPFQERRSGDAE